MSDVKQLEYKSKSATHTCAERANKKYGNPLQSLADNLSTV